MLKKLLASAGIVALCAATTATAQDIDLSTDFDTFYSFGDSLSDVGNAGRFTNAEVWTELLGLTSLPSLSGGTNFSFGGAQAEDPAGSLANIVPDSGDQIALFTGGGGTFGSDDLVSLWIGGNNFLPAAGAPGATTATIGAAALDAVSDIQANIISLIGAGAENIVVNSLPDLSVTPLVQGVGGAAIPGAIVYTDTFNTALAATIEGLQASFPGVTITPVDVASSFEAILENPGAFGYTNVTDPCLGNPSCTGFDEYLFWDGFHPTETGHQLVAALVAASLGNASDALAASALGETGIWMRQRGSRMAFNRLNNLRNISGEGDEIAGVYASGERVQADLDGSGDRSQYDYNLTSYRLGFDKKIKRGLIAGIAAGFTNSETEGELVDFDGQAVQFDAYAGLDTFNFFANLGVGFGTGSYEDYERRIPGLPLKNTSETIDAIQYSAGAEVGYRFGFDGIQIVPMAGLDFIHSSVDGFTESSDVGTGFNVGDQDVDALVGSLDLMLQKAWGNEGGTSYTSYFRAGYEDFLSYSGAEYDVALQGSGAGGTIDPDDPDAAGTNFGLGFAAGFANSAYLGFDYGLDLRNGEGTAHSGQLRLGYFLN